MQKPPNKKEFLGGWVAIVDGEQVAKSSSHRGLYEILEKKNIYGATVSFYPPSDGEEVDYIY